ncbi:hypothetical protein BHU72_01055 [Desulfuribacillus stibiiarsenatis]|uniref:Diguanylate cyclase n=1 Tax=Desulfuribacillus stibiiarsenatis TaxID=1390249 RepID=A0A1E5L9R6_9FIRM|nr:EAL domain-containing protein [Desulfuribacillus stibiiarsenatis]OEH86881.1 hypothetical protein BHU72_01055 [Desulfuribacillus stibiiarsenatis]
MQNFIASKPEDIVNKKKLIHLPLLIGLLAILTVAFFTYQTSKYLLLEQMRNDGINIAKISAKKIELEKKSMDIIDTLVEEKIAIAGQIIASHKELGINNDILREIATDTFTDEINYFSAEGIILYSTMDDYIGLGPVEGHPIEVFRASGLDELYEEIRNDTVTGVPIKHGYKRFSDGTFVQIGILESKFQIYSYVFHQQKSVKDLAKEENIAYALILNTDFQAIADSDIEDIGAEYTDDEDYARVLQGESHSFYWFYEMANTEVLEVAVPIYEDDIVVGVLGIGLYLDAVKSSIYINLLITFGITIFAALSYIYVSNRNIIQPVLSLNRNIHSIDVVNHRGYRIPYKDKDTFSGLSKSINQILDEINAYISLLHQKDQRIKHIAYHDMLTSLPNHRSFVENLKGELDNHQAGTVILLGIDNFKGINATLGHVYGDEILKKIADDLMQIQHEQLLISKFDGDKFFLIMKETDETVIEENVQRILSIFRNNFTIEGSELYVTVSMGITRYPQDGHDVSTLVMNADMALNAMKKSGKNGYYYFTNEMAEVLNEKIHVEHILRGALKEQDFKLLYQPQVDTMNGEIVGFEALIRLKNHTLSPMQFIPIAEETGMIIEIGRWVTSEVIQQLARWKQLGLPEKPVSINFSAKQLQDTQYIQFLKEQLDAHSIPAKLIEIEITESVLFYKKDVTIDFIKQIKNLGIQIAIDDFGTGYSSFSYLTLLPLDKIKIDKSFIDEVMKSKHYKILRGIIKIAHSIDLKIVAEGVEKKEQYEILKRENCQYLQGYLFSKPLEIENATAIYDQKLI